MYRYTKVEYRLCCSITWLAVPNMSAWQLRTLNPTSSSASLVITVDHCIAWKMYRHTRVKYRLCHSITGWSGRHCRSLHCHFLKNGIDTKVGYRLCCSITGWSGHHCRSLHCQSLKYVQICRYRVQSTACCSTNGIITWLAALSIGGVWVVRIFYQYSEFWQHFINTLNFDDILSTLYLLKVGAKFSGLLTKADAKGGDHILHAEDQTAYGHANETDETAPHDHLTHSELLSKHDANRCCNTTHRGIMPSARSPHSWSPDT